MIYIGFMFSSLGDFLTFNPFVVGSIPAHPTNVFNGLAAQRQAIF